MTGTFRDRSVDTGGQVSCMARETPEDPLVVTREVRDEVETVTLGGELDLASADQLTAIAADVSSPCVLLDLSALAFMDPAGVRALLSVTAQARRAGRRLAIVCPPGSAAYRTLRLTGMLGKVRVYRDADLAREALTAS